jgi:hypothetical protein
VASDEHTVASNTFDESRMMAGYLMMTPWRLIVIAWAYL